MKNSLKTTFKKEQNIVIGAIHLPPLLGFPEFPGLSLALRNALSDLRALERGGVDGIIFENNYDNPHTANAKPGTIACMALIGQELRRATKLPLGISVLWNDYETGLVLAKLLGLQFIRVSVFVDDVKTQYGVFRANPKRVVAVRAALQAQRVALFTDIHVKHAKLLSKRTIEQSANLAIKNGSDALLVTGRWTGEAPDINQLAHLRRKISKFPILLGSGLDADNVSGLFRYVNGGIVGTSIKKGKKIGREINVKSYRQRIDVERVKHLVSAIQP